MQFLQITNSGEIDPRALTLQGASTKRDDSDMIGKFGSGNKYALAALLRLGHTVKVWSGTRPITIETVEEKFRDHTFNVLVVDGQRTSITKETGPDWTVCDAIREFWSNALDEGEAQRAIISPKWDFCGRRGETTILISMSTELEAMWNHWNLYFIEGDQNLLYKCPNGSIYNHVTTNYYRKGVWICEDRQLPGLFSYSFTDIDLPESRKLSSSAIAYSLWSILNNCTNEIVLDALLDTAKTSKKCSEWTSLCYYFPVTLASTLQKHLVDKGYAYLGCLEQMSQVPEHEHHRVFWGVSERILAMVKAGVLGSIHDEAKYSKPYKIGPWPIGLEARVEAACATLKKHGVDLSPYVIVFGTLKDVGSAVVALADMELKCCVLTDAAIQASPTMLMKALIEEWTHLKHGVHDLTVAQQHVYLDLIVSLMGEK